MKKSMKLAILIFALASIGSCKKDEVNVSCYECSNDIESIDVCEENGDFVVDGEVIENPNNVSLEVFIEAIEENPNNDPDLEGVTCRRK